MKTPNFFCKAKTLSHVVLASSLHVLVSNAATSPDISINVIHEFQGTDGELRKLGELKRYYSEPGFDPETKLTYGNDGSIYGTAYRGGTNDEGVLYKIDPQGKFIALHNFDTKDGGGLPTTSVAIGLDGSLYGVASTKYLDPNDTNAVLNPFYKFSSQNGYQTLLSTGGLGSPQIGSSSPIAKADGTIYLKAAPDLTSTTSYIYKLSANGEIKRLDLDDMEVTAKLILGKDGEAYQAEWSRLNWDILKIGADDTYTPTLTIPEGFSLSTPQQDSAGNFYFTSDYGGNAGLGSVFKASSTGAVTYLYHFTDSSPLPRDSAPDSESVLSGDVVPAADGSVYGTTRLGGEFDHGTLYKIDSNGSHSVLHDYTVAEGYPGDIVMGADGNLYQTVDGGNQGKGAVLKINLGQVPTTTSLAVTPESAELNNTLTLVVSVSSNPPQATLPTGEVTFYDGNTVLGTAPINNGTAKLSTDKLAAGKHTIKAKYAGDSKNRLSESNTVTIEIKAGNIPPVAVNDNYNISSCRRPIIIPAPGILTNDSDADNDKLSVVTPSASIPRIAKVAGGKVVVFKNGKLVYLPWGRKCPSVVNFQYRLTDGKAKSNVAKVTINVKNQPAGSSN